jgi:phosphoglycolate phosphatase
MVVESHPAGLAVRMNRPIPGRLLKLLVFDLDGTLADTSQDLCNSVNATLRRFGWRTLTDDTISCFLGDGMQALLRRSLAASGGIAEAAITQKVFEPMWHFFFTYYLNHALDFTDAYPGVRQAMDVLRATPRKLAVLTNKAIRPARQILEGLSLARYFWRVYGGDSFPVKKPDPTGLLALIQEAGVHPEETVMIGDGKTDVLAARNAGAWILGCDFGFGPRNVREESPDVIVNSPKAWSLILNAGPPQQASAARLDGRASI